MHLVRYHAFDALEPLASEWNALARGVPFRRWEWLSQWWLAYGVDHPDRELYVICVFDAAGHLAAVAPWYIEALPVEGRVVQFLGNEAACSDYLTVLCDARHEAPVARALADWLSTQRTSLSEWLNDAHADSWDTIHLDGVDAEDRIVLALVDELACLGHHIHRGPGVNCWRLPLAPTWDAWLAGLSKNSRRMMRKSRQRLAETPSLEMRTLDTVGDLRAGLDVLMRLHQARWQRLGEPGCFGSAQFAGFFSSVTRNLLESGAVRLQWLELHGKPIAADYFLLGQDVAYLYQGGMHPDFLHWEPGRLSLVAGIEWAIGAGYRAVDLLRGDEPYKAHYQAFPRPSMNHRVVAAKMGAQARHSAWRAGGWLKGWIKDLLRTPEPT
ncbi:MAG: GNAT family N-acetyltransferase [Pirellulales bacterium]|nr:GNAT family N-acetyltransferase [Pirellulales bacterium]